MKLMVKVTDMGLIYEVQFVFLKHRINSDAAESIGILYKLLISCVFYLYFKI